MLVHITAEIEMTFLWLMFLCFSFVVVTQSSLVNLFFFHSVFPPKAFWVVCEMFRKQLYKLFFHQNETKTWIEDQDTAKIEMTFLWLVFLSLAFIIVTHCGLVNPLFLHTILATKTFSIILWTVQKWLLYDTQKNREDDA